MQYPGLSGSTTVLITAGASGIGRTTAESFLAAGARVHICDIDSAALDNCSNANPGLTASVTDVSDATEVDRLFEQFNAHHGHLDVLINNAGIAGPTALVEDVDVDAWKQCISVSLSGAFFCARKAAPLLKARRSGSIINMASTAALFGFPLRSAYAAAKWGVVGLTKTWAMELGPFGIRVNAICPGSVSGPRIDGVIERDAQQRQLSAEQVRDVYLRQSSMRLFVDAQDIANMALFLSSDLGRNVSGQAIGVDGHTEGLSNTLDS